MSKTYAIGDLHGRLDILEEVLRIIEEDAGSEPATFVCCGDFIDRGPDGAGIIARFRAGPTLPNWKWIILKGNHEDIMWQICSRNAGLRWWIGNGGGPTLMSYGYADGDNLFPLKDQLASDVEWTNSLPIYYMDEHRAFVHAGFNYNQPLEYQSPQEMMWQYDPDETDYSFDGRHVVCGHVQHEDGPIMTTNRTNVDTFAWLYGRQAIAVFDDVAPGGPTRLLWAECAPHPSLNNFPI